MLVIQEDVKDSGECVHTAGCVHTHISDCKTADFLPVRVSSRAFVPLWIFSLLSYLSGVCQTFLYGGVGGILHEPAVFSFALTSVNDI